KRKQPGPPTRRSPQRGRESKPRPGKSRSYSSVSSPFSDGGKRELLFGSLNDPASGLGLSLVRLGNRLDVLALGLHSIRNLRASLDGLDDTLATLCGQTSLGNSLGDL